MNNINKLGIRIVLITMIVIAVISGLVWAVFALIGSGNKTFAPLAVQQIESAPPADSDADGLADNLEQSYNTDLLTADSDGDGTNDLEELLAGRDPAVAGPDDANKPATGEDVAEANTLTQQYLASLPADAARDDILKKETLEKFVNDNKGALLPELAVGTLLTSQDTGKVAIQTYLNNVSSTHNTKLTPVTNDDIEAGLKAKLQLDAGPLKNVVASLEQNIDTLKIVTAPAETADLHRTLLQASQALLDNVLLLANIDQDFVGGLIASSNIDSLALVFQDLAGQIAALEKKYQIS